MTAGLLGGSDNAEEVRGEGGPAHEEAIDVRLGDEAVGTGALDRAAIDDAQVLGHTSTQLLRGPRPDGRMHILSLLRGRHLHTHKYHPTYSQTRFNAHWAQDDTMTTYKPDSLRNLSQTLHANSMKVIHALYQADRLS